MHLLPRHNRGARRAVELRRLRLHGNRLADLQRCNARANGVIPL